MSNVGAAYAEQSAGRAAYGEQGEKIYPYYPIFWKPDYSIIDVVVLEKKKNYYKVLLGFDDIGYVKKDRRTSFFRWSEFLKQSTGIRLKSTGKNYVKVLSVNGDYLIAFQNNSKMQPEQIRWKRENELLIEIFLLE